MNSKRLFTLFSLLLVTIMVLTSCAPAATPSEAPAVEVAPAEVSPATEAPAVTSPTEVVNTEVAPTEAPALKEMTTALTLNPISLNPMIGVDFNSIEIVRAMNEGLTTILPDGTTPMGSGLAESWEISEDGRVYTFHLKDVLWSDGSPVTAEDFVYSWQKQVEPGTAAYYGWLLFVVVNGEKINTGEITDLNELGVKAIDDKTLEVTLIDPIPYFIQTVAFSTLTPVKKSLYEELGTEGYGMAPGKMVSTGPFVLKEYILDQEIVLEKNPYYWNKDKVNLDKLTFLIVKDPNTQVNMYDTGQLDILAVTPDYAERYQNDPGYIIAPNAAVQYIMFDHTGVFSSNLKIRQAFNMTMDRNAYVNEFLHNGNIPAFGLVPPGVLGKTGEPGDFRSQAEAKNGVYFCDVSTCPEGREATLAKANQLLDEGLVELGKTRKDMNGIILITGPDEEGQRSGAIWQQMWNEAFGINFGYLSARYSIRREEYKKGYFTGKEGNSADYNDAYYFFPEFFKGASSMHYDDPKYEELVRNASSLEYNDRIDALITAEKMLFDNTAIIPTFYVAYTFVSQPYITGMVYPLVGLFRDYHWVDIVK